jgi:hypothetical protein
MADVHQQHLLTPDEMWVPRPHDKFGVSDVLTTDRHFIALHNDKEAKYWYNEAYLALCPCSFDSYMCGSPLSDILLPGDNGGFRYGSNREQHK